MRGFVGEMGQIGPLGSDAPGNLDGLDAVVPQLTVKRIPDGTHWVVHEKREQVNGFIRDFIDPIVAGLIACVILALLFERYLRCQAPDASW